MSRQKHQQATSFLLKSIFARTLKPDTRLPTETRLSEQIGVDRGSLRLALKQVEAMGVLAIRHGGGAYVKDYVKHAGVDFLNALFQHLRDPDDEELDVTYLCDEMWEFWAVFYPAVIEMASSRFSIRDVKAMIDNLNEQDACIGDAHRLAELQVRSQDLVAEVVDNTIVLLLFNSCRPLRRRMTEILCRATSDHDMSEHIQLNKGLLTAVLSEPSRDTRQAVTLYKQAFQSLTATFKRAIQEERGKKGLN